MTSIERARVERNERKEADRKAPYDIRREMKFDLDLEPESKNTEIAAEICEILIKRQISYMDMNEALYLADKALHHRALSCIGTSQKDKNYVSLSDSESREWTMQ